jgi:hypothetical protein
VGVLGYQAVFEATQVAKEVVVHDKKSGKEYFTLGADVSQWAEPGDDDEGDAEDDGEYIPDVFDEDEDLSDFSDMEDGDDDEEDE